MASRSFNRVLPAAFAGWLVLHAFTAMAQERPSLPKFTGAHVIVEGVPDQFDDLKSQIARLEKSSPQKYYVVVVKSAGTGRSPAVQYVSDLFNAWRDQASRSSPSFDPERSVVIVVAVETHQVALRAGTTLSRKFGLDRRTIQSELIRPFQERAQEGQYHEAIAALLNDTNNWIAKQDNDTIYAQVQVNSSKPAAPAKVSKAQTKLTVPAPDEPVEDAENEPNSTAAQPQPVKRASSEWWAVLVLWIPIALLALAIAVWVWILYRRAQQRVAGRLKEIKSKAVNVMDRLDGLKERLKLLPTAAGFTQPIAGETKSRYDAINQKVGGLWDGWLQVMDVLEKAQKLAARAGSPLSQKTLGEAEELINKQGSFEDIEKQAQSIAQEVDVLDKAHQEARAALDGLAASRQKTEEGLGEIAKLSLPQGPYQEEQAAVAAATKEASARLPGDPIGTKTLLEQINTRWDGLAVRISRIVTLAGDSQKLKTSIDATKRQAATHRAQGLRLVEEGGNPDQALVQADQALAATMGQIKAGDPDAAAHELEATKSAAAEAQATIEKVQKARSACERELVARARETERLRAALPQAQNYQTELDRDFARPSWQPVARNFEQAQSLLATFDRQAQEAAACATSTRQEYLRGAAQLEELARQQQIVLRLMSGLGEQLSGLIGVRKECRQQIDELAGRERQVELAIRQNEAIISDVARQSLDNARRLRDEASSRSSQERPDWPTLRNRLAEAAEDLAIAQSQADDDIRNYQALTQEFEQVRATASRVYAFLASHEEDRLAANQHYQAAADALDRVAAEMNEPRGRSAALLAQVRGAAGDLSTSEELAREDVRLAGQAQAEINQAIGAISQARSYSSSGVMVNTSAPEAAVNQAQQLLQSQNYEQSIRSAGGAMQRAREIYYRAMQEALFTQMNVQAEMRRRSVRMAAPPWNGVSFGTAAATAAAAAILDRVATGATDLSEPAVAGGSWSEDPAAVVSDDAAGGSW